MDGNEILYRYLDSCDDTHFGIAQVAHLVLKERIAYVEDWYEYNEHINSWQKLQRDYALRILLSTDVSGAYSERSIFWYNQSHLPDLNPEEKDKYFYVSKVLHKISIKLKQHEFKNSIIKECKCLFWTENLLP